ncbi:MAG: T9SS type A sorting domain-containing protein [Bacteroidales bacterium]|jgi:hypothetical protein|nr:T9SS type A sorting domain-containing protein [Bacteroidales bacterium]
MKKIIFILASVLAVVWNTTAQGYDPEEYYAPDVEVINNLIRNNGLRANIDDPDGWKNLLMFEGGFPIVTWTVTIPKRLLSLDLRMAGLTGIASFSGLDSLTSLVCCKSNLPNCDDMFGLFNCIDNNLIGINIAGCVSLKYFIADANDLIGIDLTDCNVLNYFSCYNCNLSMLDLTKVGAMTQNLEVDVTNNQLTSISFAEAYLFPLHIYASGQNVPLVLRKHEEMYVCAILLENPFFTNPIYYDAVGILQSFDTTITTTEFEVQYSEFGTLSGTMYLSYTDVVKIDEQGQNVTKVYFNRNQNMLVVEYGNLAPLTITIHDILGKKIITHTLHSTTEIDVNHLQKGVYAVTVVSEGKVIGNTKIVK